LCLNCKIICRVNIITEFEVNVKSKQYIVVNIEPYDLDSKTISAIHLLCYNCQKMLKKQYENIDESIKRNLNFVEIHCFICNMRHNVNKTIIEGVVVKEKCCSMKSCICF